MINITEKKENPLLLRKELKGELEYSAATPSNEQVARQIADSEKADQKLVKIKQIKNIYGQRKAKVSAYIYGSEEAMKSAEERKKKQKGGAQPAEGGGEKASEAPKPEAPKEEPKDGKPEEKPVEEKPAEEKQEEAPKEQASEEKKE
ncbi:hypothetical protein GF351_04065 [Candidatus Woesearchaeota archaeon]|nr:hypothetical protein [Candidatus Woesearchaeota archaeon]